MLPKIAHRIIKTTLPSDGREVRFRPMTGKEEKILLVARETDDGEEILSSVTQIVRNCVLDELDIGGLPVFDVEWLFIQIRIESVSPISQVAYVDGSDQRTYEHEVDLREVRVPDVPEPGIIRVDDQVSIQLRWPRVGDFTDPSVIGAEAEGDVAHELGVRSIEAVYDGDQRIEADSEPREELEAFVSSLDTDSYKALIEHVANTPSLRYEIKYTNSKGEEREILLENLTDFFTFS